MTIKNIPIILASGSPRRRWLLKRAGVRTKVCAPNITEKRIPGETPRTTVKRLAKVKAFFVFKKLTLKKPTLILAADTLVVAPDKKTVLGKPHSYKAAFRMLNLLSGRTHQVLTGYCLILAGLGSAKPDWVLIRAVSSRVKMKKLSQKLISQYLKTKEPYDKAGAYAAQGKAARFIEKITGSTTNVVGLPMEKLLEDLRKKLL